MKRERSPYSDHSSGNRDDKRKRRRKEDDRDDRRSPSPSRHRDRHEKGSSRLEDELYASRKSIRKERDSKSKRHDRRRSRSRSPRRGEHRSDRRKSRHDDSPHPREEESSGRHRDSKSKRKSSPRSSRDASKRRETERPSALEAEVPLRGEAISEEGNSPIGPQEPLSGTAPKVIASKMDKYFAEDYDPRLDVSPALTGKDGLIPPGAFDNWDMMLEIVRARREEKEEKKRLEKLHRSGSSSKTKDSATVLPKKDEAEDILNIQYTKRGGVREWDEGKKVTS